MNIKLESLSVTGIMPFNQFNHHFMNINLIYGKNEQGKTNLVDFLLQSLFKGQHNTRSLPINGALMVEGLKSDRVKFNPSQKVKLESLLITGEESKLADLARLCVVKGGDLSFDPNSKNNLPFQYIRNYLSDQKTFDRIAKKVNSKSELTCRVENGALVTGDNMGEIKKYNRKLDELKEIDGHIQKINNDTSAQSIFQNTKKLAEVDQEIGSQQKAKQHLAFTLSQKIGQQEQKARLYPEGVIVTARNLLNVLESDQQQLILLNIRLGSAQNECKDLGWLLQAEIEYSNRSFANKNQAHWGFITLALLGIVTSVIFSFLQLPIFSLIAGVISIGFAYFAARSFLNTDIEKKARYDADRFFKELGQRLSVTNPSVITLQDAIKKQNAAKINAEALQTQINDLKNKIENSRKELRDLQNQHFSNLGETTLSYDMLHRLEETRRLLEAEKDNLTKQLNQVGVAELDYLSDPVEVGYSQQRHEQFKMERDSLAGQIENDKSKAQDIAHEAARIAGVPITTNLQDILDGLRTKRNGLEAEIQGRRSDIFAMLSLKKALDEHQANELGMIQSTLASTSCGQVLHKITRRYDSITIEDEKLVIREEFDSHILSEVSTGTQEQVLLAVRIGLLNYVLKNRKSFLILDDAFQHSDWDRRENLIDVLAELAKDGWQILYFTMDDHIRDLFETRLKPRFPGEYQLIDLGAL